MQALVLTAYGRLELQEVPRPVVGAGEVLVRVEACGICGSDVHGMDGSTGRRRPPIIMGHEAAGVVAQIGPDTTGWALGDRLTFDSTLSCGRCEFCRRGRVNLCDRRQVLGVSCEEYRRDGAMAQFLAVPQHVLYRLPDDVRFEEAAMVEPLSVALHAVRRAEVQLGQPAVVIGAGMIGLLAVQALRAAGCGLVVAVDLDPKKLELARHLGADLALRGDAAELPGEVLRHTGGRGAEVVIEAVGIAATVRLALSCAAKGGRIVLVGNVSPEVDLPLQAAVTREITLLGSCASAGEYPTCLALIARGAIRLDPLTTAVAPLSEGPAWFGRLRDTPEGLLKVILKP